MSIHNVLLTGAGGFIGSHLAQDLVERGAKVRAFVRYNSRGDSGFLKQLDPKIKSEIEIVSGDLNDPDAVARAVNGCDTVFHLGALMQKQVGKQDLEQRAAALQYQRDGHVLLQHDEAEQYMCQRQHDCGYGPEMPRDQAQLRFPFARV